MTNVVALSAALLAAVVSPTNSATPAGAASLHVQTPGATDPFAAIAAGKTVLRRSDGTPEATYHYRLVEPRPQAIADPGARVPLVVFLHGSGERGEDNRAQLVHFAGACATEAFQQKAPCYVLAVQCPSNEIWSPIDLKAYQERGELPKFAKHPTRAMRAVMQAIDEVVATKAVDPTRIYLTGLSMGGFGAFDLAARRPGFFAAVVPICGGGDPATAKLVAETPFYIVHGADDPIVPVAFSRAMREAIVAAGVAAGAAQEKTGTPEKTRASSAPTTNPKYREYDGVGHDSWTPAYRFGSDGILDWMFAQRNG